MLRKPNPLTILAALTIFVAAFASCQSEGGESNCGDGQDNDGDGLVDCADDDCAASQDCACGNGEMDGTEECDGQDFGGTFCSDVNPAFVGGYLTCLPNCVIDVAHCELPVCGDDIAEGDEDCDGYDMGQTASCDLLGHLGGSVHCNDDCTYDTSDCWDVVTCDDIDIQGVTSEAAYGAPTTNGSYQWLYNSFVDLGDGKNWWLRVELWGDAAAGGIQTGPYTYTEDDPSGYKTCAYCTLLIECADAACDYPTWFYIPTAGTLDLTSLGQAPSGTLAATLSDMSFWKVEINWDTYDSTPIEVGPCHDLYSDYTLDATVDAWPM